MEFKNTDEMILPFYTIDYVVEDITAGRIREGWEGLGNGQKVCSLRFPIFIIHW